MIWFNIHETKFAQLTSSPVISQEGAWDLVVMVMHRPSNEMGKGQFMFPQLCTDMHTARVGGWVQDFALIQPHKKVT
jgi:hypothetical protein